jgi:Protein CHAPERONE-LIKE PROTEIN OF POR1-like
MSEQGPYECLGVTEESSFDEIQRARTKLITASGEDRKRVEQIEAAYDAVLMHRLRLRQEGKIKVPERIRFPERTVPEVATPALSQSKPLPSWISQMLDEPSPQDIVWPAAVSGGLAVASLMPFAQDGTLLYGLLMLGAGSTVYFLNRKEGKFGRSVFVTFAALMGGLLLGALLAGLLKTLLVSLGLPIVLESQLVTAIAMIVFWLVASFLR